MDFHLPQLGEGVYEAELIRWLVPVGATVKRGQNLAEVMTDKATMELPAPFAGKITALNAEPGQQIKVGEVVLHYDGPEGKPSGKTRNGKEIANGSKAADVPVKEKVAANVTSSTAVPLTVKAAPSVRLMARKLGLDLTQIRGSGPQGRILIEDLSSLTQPARTEAKPTKDEPPFDLGKAGTRVKLQGMRRKIAEHMVHAKQTIPHYSYVDECDVTEMVRLRAALRETYAKAGIKLTYMAFIIKAVTAALKEVPLVNASLDEAAGEIVLHDRYHVGVAVAAPHGLLVPVIHDADQKDLGQIAREIERLGTEARRGAAKLEDLRGGTFTVTSIGGIGGLFSTPIINHPQVGILGVGKVVKRPVYDEAGNVRPADLLYLSLSFDHRVVDGAIGATFGNAVSKRLQNPALLLLPESLVSAR